MGIKVDGGIKRKTEMLVLALDTLLGPSAKISRLYGLLLVIFMGAVTLELVDYQQISLNWKAVWRGEVWRMCLCFLWTGPLSLHSCWESFMLYTYMAKLEEEAYHRRTAEFVWLLMNSAVILLLTHYVLSNYLPMDRTLSSDLFLLLTYLWGRKNPHARAHLLLISVPAGYLAWVHATFKYTLGSNPSLLVSYLGVLAGHIVFFFDCYIPTMPVTKGFYLFGMTPNFLKRLLPEEGDNVEQPARAAANADDPSLWEDATAFLTGQ